MTDPFQRLSEEQREKLGRGKQPKWTGPMLATLVHEPFSDPQWLFERKLDGERVLAFRTRDGVRLMTRNRKQINNTYPELAEALERQPAKDFIADGEVVAFDGAVTSFSRLQKRMQIRDREEARRSPVAVYFYLFDLLHLAGHDVTQLPLRVRKTLLRDSIDFAGRLRYTPHRNETGKAYLRQACEKGWEGLIAKKADSPYRHSRSRDWLKFKCSRGQEMVIAGFTEPKGSRTGFGALLLGYYESGELQYAGRVGTGFDEAELRRLHARLKSITRSSSPFADADIAEKEVTFVQPKLVAEIGFTEWTHEGKLRHPRYLGLRRDKKPREVVRERPAD
jgi:bifunctional non-homologous end joining protein LigD